MNMPIDFHHEHHQHAYVGRQVDPGWLSFIRSITDVNGKDVVDIGCGGGIYTQALARLGASTVTGVDFSEQMLRAAKVQCQGRYNIRFQQGDANDTDLADERYDLVLQRALIHHLQDLLPCFQEAQRILNKGGTLLIQDRTPEDCLLPGSPAHIRGYFFSLFPDLREIEIQRRHTDQTVQRALREAGFERVTVFQLWETRRIYEDITELRQDLLQRKGRSILHELSDPQLNVLVDKLTHLLQKSLGTEPIFEQDRWTIWLAGKTG
jgi:ubiquinone/menaquinone biosynthesis C-methylase UbiE